MADTKVTALTANTTPLAGDYLYQIDDPAGTPTSKRMTIGDLSIANSPVQGGLVNGYIDRTVASNNLTVAIKTLAGSDPSATDPVYVRIGNAVRTITAALSVTINAGTDTFALGAGGCLTDQDLFTYLGYRAAGSAVFIGVARYAHGILYSDFSATATNQGYLAYSGSAPASSDVVELVGRFNVTTSGSALYNWSVPATSLIISRPIFETRWLDYTPTLTGFSANPSSTVYKYKVLYNRVAVYSRQGANGTSNATTFTISGPFTAVTLTNGIWQAPAWPTFDNGGAAASTPGAVSIATAASTINVWINSNLGTTAWTNVNGKRVGFFELWYPLS